MVIKQQLRHKNYEYAANNYPTNWRVGTLT